ncbi:hypothetical protein F7725_017623, partial [Dissostichus mawsoni]
MPPLTSPSGCGGCLRMSQKISELEGRISMLYQIRDDEQILDSLVTIGPAATTTACELDDTVPWMDVAARSDHWSQLGAKPTPSQREPWTDVRRGKQRGKLICRPTPPRALQLTNGYSILGEEDFPPPPVNAEFMRITTFPLETKFLAQLDKHSTKLLQVIRSRGGVVKQKTTGILQVLDEKRMHPQISMIYLGEPVDHLIKEFQETEAGELEQATMEIFVTGKEDPFHPPKD